MSAVLRPSWVSLGIAAAPYAAAQSLAATPPVGAEGSGFEAALAWQTGEVSLGKGLARLSLTSDWRFLGPDDAERVLVEAWHNPPDRDKPLGMLFPADVGPSDRDGWAVILYYADEGHVSDDDAASQDYDALLRDLQAAVKEGNAQRVKDGYGEVELIGWAARPFYDRDTRKLHWARELRFESDDENTLNYDVRVLGRRGYLLMKAVAPMSLSEPVQARMREALTLVEFTPGHRYEDFDSSADKVAAYGIGGLVAGGLLAKAGFFKLLLGGLLAAKKFVVVGVFAAGSAVARYWRRGRIGVRPVD